MSDLASETLREMAKFIHENVFVTANSAASVDWEAERERLEEAFGELEHIYAFDQTASDEQRAWWIAKALEHQSNE